MRFDNHNAPFAGNQHQVSPRVKLSFFPNPANTFWVYYGRLFVPTNVEDLRAITSVADSGVVTAPTLPERDNFYEVGYVHRFPFGVVTKLEFRLFPITEVYAGTLFFPADRLREVLVLRELEGLSYIEIAEVVGIPMGTVMSSLFRARERFRHAANDLGRRQSQPKGSPALGDAERQELEQDAVPV